MKYKYISGTETDFNGAPAWAKIVISNGAHCAFSNELDYMSPAVWVNGGEFRVANPTKFTIVAAREIQSGEPEWNGEGLPPVGCECECHLDDGIVNSIVVGYDFNGKTVVMRNVSARKYFSVQSDSGNIKPLRSEADKKRDAAIEALVEVYRNALGDVTGAFGCVYDAIASGKITGVKLED